MNSDGPGACSGRYAVLKFGELLWRQCSHWRKCRLFIFLFFYCQISVNENIFLSFLYEIL